MRRWPEEADPRAQAVGGEVERRWHCSGDGLGRRVCRGGLPRPGEALWGVVLHGFGADEGVHRTGLDGGVSGGGERSSQRALSDLHGEKRCVSLREGRRSLIGGCRGLGVTGDGCSAAGWCSAVAMAMAGGVPGRREESGGSDWGGMERRGGVPVEAAGESRTEVAARRGGGAGVEAEAEAAAAHQDGSGGGGQASRRRRHGGERSRRRGGGGGRPGGGGGRSSEVATADDRASRGPAVEGTSEEEGNRAGTYIFQRH